MTKQPLSPRQQIVYDMIFAAALKGQSCPTNDALGSRLNSASAALPSQLVGELEDLGYIAVERGARWRVVTIIATGAVTSRPPGAPPARADRLPSTVGRPDLGVGEKRRPYEGVERIKAIVERHSAEAAPPVAPVAAIVRRAPPPMPIAAPPAPPPTPPEPEIAMPTEIAPAAAAAAPAAAPLPVTMPAGPALSVDVRFTDGELQLTVYLSTDPGPVKAFRPFIIVPLDDMSAIELLGTASVALRDARLAQEAA